MDANPIGLVIIAVAALAAGLVLAYQHSATFRSIVTGAMNAVASAAHAVAAAFSAVLAAASSAFAWIVGHWQLGLFAFGPIGAAIYLIIQNFDRLKAAAADAFAAISSAISGVAGAIESVIGAVERLIGALGRIHVPHISIPGLNSLAVPEAAIASGRSAGGASYSSSGVTVNVYGAVDPEGTARSIRRILADHDRRQGR